MNDNMSIEECIDDIFSIEEMSDDVIIEDICEDDVEDIIYETSKNIAEVDTLSLALHAAEEFIFNNSLEEDDKISNFFVKFWTFIKTIFEKIVSYIITLWKRIQIWLAGDMKGISKWYTDNKLAADNAIEDDETVIRGLSIFNYKKDIKDKKDYIMSNNLLKECMITIDKNKESNKLIGLLKIELSSRLSSDYRNEVYGDKNTPKFINLKKALAGKNNVGEWLSSSSINNIKVNIGIIRKTINDNKLAINVASKKIYGKNGFINIKNNGIIGDFELGGVSAKKVKELAKLSFTFANKLSTLLVYVNFAEIKQTKLVYTLTKKIVKDSTRES